MKKLAFVVLGVVSSGFAVLCASHNYIVGTVVGLVLAGITLAISQLKGIVHLNEIRFGE